MSCSIFIGPMFSEKTTELIRHVKRSALADLDCLIVRYEKDNRYGSDTSTVYTHDGKGLIESDKIKIVKTSSLSELNVSSYHVIGIDEGQFYPDLSETVRKWLKLDKKIIISALDGDYMQKPFEQISLTIPLCYSVIKLRGVCMVCKSRDSIFTQRTSEERSREVIGGLDKYKSVCLDCYKNNL